MQIKQSLRVALGLTGIGLMAAACVTTTPEFQKERPTSFVHRPTAVETRTTGSLWRDSAGLFEDRKARGLNDLVTINIIESSSASKKADTATARQSAMDAGILNLFGKTYYSDFQLFFTLSLKGKN